MRALFAATALAGSIASIAAGCGAFTTADSGGAATADGGGTGPASGDGAVTDGGGEGATPVPVSDREPGATELVADDTHLYWNTADEIRSCAFERCEPTTLVNDRESPHALVVADGSVYWAEGKNVYLSPKSTGGSPTLLLQNSNPNNLRTLVRQASYLYYATTDDFGECIVTNCEGTRTSIGASADSDILALAPSASGADSVWGVTKAAVYAVQPHANTQRFDLPFTPSALAATDTKVYVAGESSTVVLVYDLTGGTSKITVGGRPRALAIRAGQLYIGDAAGRVLRTSTSGDGTFLETLGQGLGDLLAIAVGTRAVYVLGVDEHIRAVPLPQ